MKKIRKSLYTSILARTVLPLLILGILIAAFSSIRIAATIYTEAEESLNTLGSAIAAMYDELYPGDYIMLDEEKGLIAKGRHTVNGDYGLIDRLKSELAIDITFFYGDTRVITTITDHSGKRITGTRAGEEVVQDVLEKGEAHFYFSIQISENDYFAYYMPLYNKDGSCAGMLFIAKQSWQIRNSIYNMVFPIILLTLIFMTVIGIISIGYSRNMIAGFTKIDSFLHKVSQGDFTSAMDTAILTREDEMGDMARHIVDMQKSIKELIEQDMLTGLANRRCGEHKLIEMHKRAAEEKYPFTIAIGDIDYFKGVNDTYGHECGDAVLRNIAGLLQRNMERKGTAVRWGGEEFLLIYENMEHEAVLETLLKLMKEIREESVIYDGQEIKITMTFGTVEGSPDKIDDLIRTADDRLYYGKENGRDRIIAEAGEVK